MIDMEALRAATAKMGREDAKLLLKALQEALAESEQPKVRTGNCLRVGVCASEGHKIAPQRRWVGLTDDEIDQGLLRSDYAFKTAEAWRAGVVFAMTKLKEKNT